MHPQRTLIEAAEQIHENAIGRERARERINQFQQSGVADTRRQAVDLYRTTLLTRAHPETGEVKLPGHTDENPITLNIDPNREPRTGNFKKQLGAAKKGTEDKPGPRQVRGDKSRKKYGSWMDVVKAHQELHNRDREPNVEYRPGYGAGKNVS